MTLTELYEKKGRLVAEARAALDEIKKNTSESRAAELDARHDSIMSEFDRTEIEIDRARREAMRPKPADGWSPCVDVPAAPEHRTAFHNWLKARGDVAALTPEDRQAMGPEIRMQTTTGGAGAAGGFTVPVELANVIVESMKLSGPMYDPGVTTELVTSGGHQINIPTVNDTAVTAEPHTEGTPLTDDGGKDATFGQKRLDAYAFDTEMVKFSMELAQDSIFAMEQVLGSLLGKRLGRIANLQLTTGSGTSAPNGIVTASTLGKAAASATAITGDELIDLYHSVDPAYRSGPKVGWMFNDTTLQAIRKLKDGNGNYLWQMGNIKDGEPDRILGKPFYINQDVAGMEASARAVVFGDLGVYWVRKVGSPVIGVLRERFWPDLGIAGVIRFDGELTDTAAVKHLIMDDGV